MAKTNYITNWETWKELCQENDVDPYEYVDFGIDEGGGNSRDFEYIGDTPEREDGMKKIIKGLKTEDCGTCKFCNSPLKKIYHFDGRPNLPSTVEYICKCAKANPNKWKPTKIKSKRVAQGNMSTNRR